MTVEQLRTAREITPFQPFTIHMADGRSHRIPHRDYLSMSPGGRIVVVYGNDDAARIIDLLLVTELSIDKLAGQVDASADV